MNSAICQTLQLKENGGSIKILFLYLFSPHLLHTTYQYFILMYLIRLTTIRITQIFSFPQLIMHTQSHVITSYKNEHIEHAYRNSLYLNHSQIIFNKSTFG